MVRQRIAATLAICALSHAQVAQAKDCIAASDVSDAVVYIVPVAHSAFTEKCEAKLENDGFVARRGGEFVAPFREMHSKTWPGAYRALTHFIRDAEQKKQLSQFMTSMPPEAASAFFDAVIKMEIVKGIKIEDCGKIERMIEPLAPLPPRNFGQAVAAFVDLVPRKKPPQVCAATTK